jgi:antitoxin VapB
MSTARVFKSGNSQTVRLPKQFHFRADEVEVFRRGEEIVLREPKRNLHKAFAALATMPRDFMARGQQDQVPQQRDAIVKRRAR